MDAAPARHIGKFKVVKVLGAGGMGEVLLAEDDLLGRVAIKRPLKGADADTLARFQVEKSVAGLTHPNIPRVYELGEEDGLPYIAMEFVEGDSLDKVIAGNKPLDLITKLAVIEQACLALGYAHQQGIIHRDVKPANIIVQANGVAKIIDFGIAKVEAPGSTALTKTSQLIGTLHYIAPERFKGEAVDRRSDIFSLGAVLYELITGKLLFAGGEHTAFHKILNAQPASLVGEVDGYPPALDAVLARSLAKNPEDRYTYAEDFGDDLHAVIEDLKRNGVLERLERAEKLTMEGRFSTAIEVLDEAMRLDPASTQVRKLKKFVRNKQEEKRRDERVEGLIHLAEKAVAAEDFTAALASLNEASEINAQFPGLAEAITALQQRKQRQDVVTAVLQQATEMGNRGDYVGALHIVTVALSSDPQNARLLAAHAALTKMAESSLKKSKVEEIAAMARNALDTGKYASVEPLLAEAEQIEPGNPEIEAVRRKTIAVLEAVLLDFGDRTDIKELLASSRRALQARARAAIIERCKSEVQECLQDGRLDDAILALQVRVRETGDEYLTKCLAELTEQRNTAMRRLQQLRERVADLRKEGELDTALQLVRDHNAASVKLQGAEELLAELTSECERRDTIENAIRRAHEAVIAKDFEGASGTIRSIIKVYGDSPVLTRELQDIETARAEFAKDNLTRAITAARKAYLNGDPAGALATLNNVAPVLEFADPATREEWKRIADSASESTQKTAVSTAPNTAINATQSVAFNTSTSLEAPPRPKKSSWIMIAAAAVLVVVAGAVALVMYLSPGKSGTSAGKTPPPAVAGQPQSTSPASGTQSPPSTNAPQPPPGATSTGASPQSGTGTVTQLSSKGSDVEDWRAVNASPSLDKIDRYLQLHPNGAFRSQALAKRDDLTWAGAMSSDTQASIDSYLQQYPSGKHSQAARTEVARLDGNAINSSNDPATLEAFLRKYPSGNLHSEAENRLDDVDWAQNRKDSAGLQAYLSQFPGGRHAAEARSSLKSLQTANSASTAAAKARVSAPSERAAQSSQGGATDDRSVILGTLKSYQDAYDRQDEGAIERLWPTMTKKQKKDTSNLFKSGVTAIQMTIDVLSGPDISGGDASVTASEIMALSHGGGFDTHTSKVTIKLKKAPAGNAWFIDSIR